jgi:hypothetical protein
MQVTEKFISTQYLIISVDKELGERERDRFNFPSLQKLTRLLGNQQLK